MGLTALESTFFAKVFCQARHHFFPDRREEIVERRAGRPDAPSYKGHAMVTVLHATRFAQTGVPDDATMASFEPFGQRTPQNGRVSYTPNACILRLVSGFGGGSASSMPLRLRLGIWKRHGPFSCYAGSSHTGRLHFGEICFGFLYKPFGLEHKIYMPFT